MDVIGGGLLVAVAALLWIAYLLPSWLRRRQYLATERNAVRLQQTLRILAETAETPEAVRVEATAREVATQQRILHEHEQAARLAARTAEHLAIAERRAAEEAADAARELAASVHAPPTEPIPVMTPSVPVANRADPVRARRALRRRRALCSLLLLVSLLTATAGLVAAMFGASLLIAAGGGAGIAAAVTGIVRLAKVRAAVAAAPPVAMPEAVPFEPIELPEESSGEHGWMPQPLPRPLHLSRGTIAATAMASIEAAAELKRAAAEAELARRAEELEPAVPTIAPAAAAPAADAATSAAASGRPAEEHASPYARMGAVDDARPGFGDLDAVLRRRRRAG
ncbi:hypothetical protein ACFWN7_03660 [Agromyces sp. NPDC058484]|uniref:hypothetical protein n=1 Tax=Agromyces sp. NPDC058484 TaxID=3346524 RepID=UPI003652B381